MSHASKPRVAMLDLASKNTAASPAALLHRSGGAADLAGDSAGLNAMAKLEMALAELKAMKIAPLLQRAIDCVRANDAHGANEWAMKALNEDERSGLAWRLLGIAREKLGDFGAAIKCFDSAMKLTPEDVEMANDIGRLAYRLDMKDIAAKLFQHFVNARPDIPDGANNLACVLRDENRYEEAIEILKAAISRHPENPQLWNTLGSVLAEEGRLAESITFFDEALRLDPHFVKARYNRGGVKLPLGDLDGALDDCESAMAQATVAEEQRMMRMARSSMLLCLGRIGEGWDDYEVRLDPEFSGFTQFMIDGPRWSRDIDLGGKSLLLVGEQGLGDEVLFANVVPDVIEALGADGELRLAVEPRLVPLFQRSFPTARVAGHATFNVNARMVRGVGAEILKGVDLWAPLATPLTRFRRSLDAFPRRERYLTPDAARVVYWTEVLKTAPQGPKVGVLWKSLKLKGARKKQFSAFEQWRPVFDTPGVTFVNLQYGECEEELAFAREAFGVELWTPPGIDLKQDLDDLAALTSALDLVLGFANATSNIAAACGANVWMIGGPSVWTQMGSGGYPWYPQVRCFNPAGFDDWNPVMQAVGDALKAKF
jgi:tetratricopeptide (TPR) repeat protein